MVEKGGGTKPTACGVFGPAWILQQEQQLIGSGGKVGCGTPLHPVQGMSGCTGAGSARRCSHSKLGSHGPSSGVRVCVCMCVMGA